jgi:Protein of unknown function (DUF778)
MMSDFVEHELNFFMQWVGKHFWIKTNKSNKNILREMASPQNGKYKAQMLNVSDEDDQSPGVSKQETEDSRWEEVAIEPKYHRFPYCIVWTPLPVISWFLPFIGHAGICT